MIIANRKLYILRVYLILILFPGTLSSQTNTSIKGLKQNLENSTGIKRLAIFNELSKEYKHIDAQKAIDYGKKAKVLAIDLGSETELQNAYINLATGYYFLSKFDSVLHYSEKAIVSADNNKNDTVFAKANMLICNANINLGNYTEASKHGEVALVNFESLDDTMEIATAQKNLSYIYKATGDYDKAMEYALAALEIFETSGDSMKIASALGTIGNILIYINKKEQGKHYFLEAEKYLENYHNSLMYAQVLQAIAGVYREEGRADSSIYFYRKSLPVAINMNNEMLVAKITMNLGNTLKEIEEYSESLNNFRIAKQKFTNLNLEKDINHVNYSMGELYFQMQKIDSSEYYLLGSLKGAKKLNHAIIYEGALNLLYQLYEIKDNYPLAHDYYKQYVQYNDSIKGDKVQLKIAGLETKYESEKKKKEIQQLKYEHNKQKSKVLILIIAFLGLAGISITLALFFINKRKRDKFILKQKDALLMQEKELATAQQEKSQIKEQELQKESDFKSRQLTTHALNMMQKNKLLQELQADINNLGKKSTSELKPDFSRLNLQINRNLKSDNDWEVFKMYFEQVNKNFYSKLLSKSPELTNYDLRLCALLKLNLNIKETASVLNVAPNSIKSARYRLRKKLNMEPEDDLYEFIRTIN